MSFTTLEDFLDRARARLDPVSGPAQLPDGGDIAHVPAERHNTLTEAAVLVPVIPRKTGPTALLTTRPETMTTHPGQVAFPGGKMEPHDPNEAATALREAEEEVGVRSETTDTIARGAPYVTGTAFRVTPVIALLPHDFVALPDRNEVANVFEVPLRILFDIAQFEARSAVWRGQRRRYYAMTYHGHYIWGVTAGIIRDLHARLYVGEV